MRKRLAIKISVFVGFILAVIGLLFFMFSGDNSQIIRSLFKDDLTSDEMIELVRSFGIRGSITLSTLSMFQVILAFLPAEPVQVLSGICYGIWHGGLVCLMGVFIGNTIMFVAYKFLGDKLMEGFRKNIDIDWDRIKNSKRVAGFIIILYFLPAIPYGLICLFTASMKIKYPRYILLTTLGAIPSIVIGVSLGHMAMATSWIVSLVVFVVLLGVLAILALKRKALFKKVNEIIHKHAIPHSSATKVKKCNPFIYVAIRIFIKVSLLFRFKFKFHKSVDAKGPCIILCNHGSFFDFLFTGRMMFKEKPHYITARMYFFHRQLAWLIRNLGGFPKSMFSTDIENVKNCIKVLSDGDALIMMPEARLSTVGRFEGIQDATYKFLKKMNVPIYVLHINGSYLSRPKWGDKLRKKSHVEADFNLLLSKEQVENISLEELKEKITNALYYDDFKWLESRPDLRYKSKTLAKGLENILFTCPNCGKKLTIRTQGNTVYCTDCGMTATLDDRYGFVDKKPFNNFAEWYDWQKAKLKEEYLADPNFNLTDNVELKHASNDGKTLMRHAGFGTCVLNRRGLTYTGSEDGKQITKFFPMNSIYRLLFGAGEDFEIYENQTLYYFVPEDLRSAVIWYVASTVMKEDEE